MFTTNEKIRVFVLILLSVILSSVHRMWYDDYGGGSRLIYIFMFVSLMIFIFLINMHHYNCLVKEKDYDKLSFENYRKLSNTTIINTDNESFKLTMLLMKHPIFSVM